MNIRKLKRAEAAFLARFPLGFDDPGLERVRKAHGVGKVADFTRANVTAHLSLSALPFYFAPSKEAFVKPSTAKRIVTYLETENLHYHARPTWAFYLGYRNLILDIKKVVHSSIAPNNAAITGFLMSTM